MPCRKENPLIVELGYNFSNFPPFSKCGFPQSGDLQN
ncbi:hypothetical protein N9Y89_01345 [bacterium]|nr:hypothetical protein [bacterium]